jgi:NAD(P)-dependent dehydrogenase (short-subunit alcohol dehydrogenase family)
VHTPAVGTMSPIAYRDPTTGNVVRHSVEMFGRIIKVNVTGSFLCSSIAAAGVMTLAPRDDERGTIILTSSIVSQDRSARIGA